MYVKKKGIVQINVKVKFVTPIGNFYSTQEDPICYVQELLVAIRINV